MLISMVIVPTILGIIPIMLHTVGIYLLLKTSSVQWNQKIYLLNLSVLEVVFELLQHLRLFLLVYSDKSTHILVSIFTFSAVIVTLANLIIMLTIDRLLEVYLNIKYKIYVTKTRTRCFIIACYGVGAVCFAFFAYLKYNNRKNCTKIHRLYFFPVYAALIIIILATTYIYIYNKIRIAKKGYRVQSRNAQSQISEQRQNRRILFTPFLIVGSFIMFVVIPETTHLVMYYNRHRPHAHGTGQYELVSDQVLRICFDVACTSDALIYILLNEPIRKSLVRHIGWRRKKQKCQLESSTVTSNTSSM